MHADARSVDEEPEQVNERRERRKMVMFQMSLKMLMVKLMIWLKL